MNTAVNSNVVHESEAQRQHARVKIPAKLRFFGPDRTPVEARVIDLSAGGLAFNAGQLLLKVGNYLSAGTTVWVVYPDTQEVDVFQPGQSVRSLSANDTLTVEHLLPGFALPVSSIFPNEES